MQPLDAGRQLGGKSDTCRRLPGAGFRGRAGWRSAPAQQTPVSSFGTGVKPTFPPPGEVGCWCYLWLGHATLLGRRRPVDNLAREPLPRRLPKEARRALRHATRRCYFQALPTAAGCLLIKQE